MTAGAAPPSPSTPDAAPEVAWRTAAVYVIRVAGAVDPAVIAGFAGLRSSAAADGAVTELVGPFRDQGAPFGALRALHAAGAPLLGLARLGPPSTESVARP